MSTTYYTLGRTGLRISRLALGTMTFGTEWGWGADQAGARQMFDRYRDHGGNFYDTADGYTGGTSEEWLGAFIRDSASRDQSVIATKFSFNAGDGDPNTGGNGRKNLLRAVEGSLKRLQTDYIDLYFLHCWDRVTPVEEVMRTLDDLVASGKVRHIGLSDVPAWYAARAQTLAEWRGYEPVSALQFEYSLVERNIEHEFIDLGQALGSGVVVWSPLGGGLLSGKYRPSNQGEQSLGRLAAMQGSDNPAFAKFTEKNWRVVAELETVAAELGRSMAQVALNWVANRPGVASVLIGATKQAQLDDNLGALDFDIPEPLRARLDTVSAPERPFPYSFFGDAIQGLLTGGARLADKPDGYTTRIRIEGAGAGVEPAAGDTGPQA